MSARPKDGFWFSLLSSGFLGAILGLWFLADPLFRFSASLQRLGQPFSALLLASAGLGAAFALLAWIPAFALRSSLQGYDLRPHLAAAAASAGVICGLLVFWFLRASTPSLAGVASLRAYAALGVVCGLAVALLGLGLELAWRRGFVWARVLGAAVLLGGVLLAVATGLIDYSQRRPPVAVAGGTAPPDGPIRRVYLITIDALRSDHLSCYGYPRDTSPVIDHLAAEGVRYGLCYSLGNRSELSLSSILTSLIPSAHGVGKTENGQAHPLSPDVTTLAEALASGGYLTLGFLTNPYLKRGLGLDQGFEFVDEFYYHYRKLVVFRLLEKIGLMRVPDVDLDVLPRANEVTDKALAVLGKHTKEPLFAFIHYMDVHHPYWPPEDLVERFHRPVSSDTDPHVLFEEVTRRDQWNESPEYGPLSEPDRNRLIDLYDGVIAYTDSEIGRLLDGLRARGMLEHSLIVISADHGDEFAEHGYFFHKNPVPIETLTRVPLIFWSPELLGRPRVVAHPVTQLDLYPSILAVLGIPDPPSIQGQPLPLLEPAVPDSTRLIVSEGVGFASARRYFDGSFWKLWWDKGAGQASLFDLSVDPGEFHDVAADHPVIEEQLKVALLDLLQRSRAAHRERPKIVMDQRTQEELRSLGYIR